MPNYLSYCQCYGSESESERIHKFWPDPNPKKVQIRLLIRIQILLKYTKFCEKSKIKHLKKTYVFLLEKISLCRTGSRTHMKSRRHHFKNFGSKYYRYYWDQNPYGIRLRKKFVDPNSKKNDSNPQHCFRLRFFLPFRPSGSGSRRPIECGSGSETLAPHVKG
jgi:hypothetical protein